jgi:UDP-perosamine 4-acetyltransferase
MTSSLLLVGNGPHAKVCIGVLVENGWELTGCTGPAPPVSGIDVPYLGSDDFAGLHARGFTAAFVAVGSNRLRARLIGELRALGIALPAAVSRHAIVSPRATVGDGALVMPGAIVNVDARIAEGAIINTGAIVDHDCSIGRFAHIAPGANLAGSVSVGEGVLCGIGSCAIANLSIGDWSVIGAGGVVIEDVPPGVTAVGVPVRRLQSASTGSAS